MTAVEYQLLGGLSASRDGRPLDLGGPKPRAVLAALLLEGGRPVPAGRLVDLVWGDDPPSRAEASLQAYVSNLRKVLEPDRRPRDEPTILLTGPSGYALATQPDQVDVQRFEDGVVRGRAELAAGRPAEAAAILDEALGLWRGPLLPELADRPWVVQPARRLADLHAAAVEDRAEAALALGRPAEVAPLVDTLVAEEPHRERLRRLQALALYRTGRQREALAALEDARRALLDSAGLEPGPELRQLERAILDHDPALAGDAASSTHPTPSAPATSTAAPSGTGQPGEPPGAPLLPERSASPHPRTADEAAPAATSARPFVGRRHELGLLLDALAAARAGAGRPVVVSGEPGIGKTRLVEELAAAAGADTVVAWARCPESAAQAAYWPCVQLGRQLVHAGVGADALTAALPEDDLPRTGEPVDRLTLHGLAAGVVVAADRPLILVVDDLQWADPASLRLLEYLAGELRRSRTLLVVTVRPLGHDAPVPLQDCMAELARQPGAVRVDLTGLTQGDVSRWLDLRAPGRVDARVAELVHDRTGGNAFFVGEVVELLASDDRLADPTVAVRDSTVPAAVHDVVRRRVGRLDPGTQQLLSTASVIGRTFDLDVLGRVAGETPLAVLDRLEEALVAGLVVETDRPGRFQFSHALVADTLTAELSAVHRARMHAATFEALLELRSGDLDEDVVALAHHAFAGASAGTAEAAHSWSVRAAEVAAARLAHEDAAEHWLRAARAAEVAWPRDLARRYAALLAAGRALRAVDAVGPAYDALVEAIDLGLAAGDTDMVLDAAAAMSIEGLWLAGEIALTNAKALGALQRAVAATPDEPSRARALALGALAENGFGQLPMDEIDRISADALRLARATGDPHVVALTLHKRNQALWAPATLAERSEAAEELLTLVEAPGADFGPDLESLALFGAASVEWEVGDPRVHDRMERARTLAVVTRAPALLTQIDFFRTALLIGRGEVKAAIQLVEDTYELYRRTRRWAADVFRAAFLTVAWMEMGRLDDIVAVAPDILGSQYAAAFGEAVAFAYLENGAPERAAPLLTELPPMFDSWMLLGVAAVGAHNRATVGDRDGARALYDVLLPYSGRMAVPGSGPALGDVDLALARVERLLGDEQSARHHLDRSVDLLTRAGNRPWLARALLERHELMGDPADLTAAADVVAGTGLQLLQNRIAALQVGSK